MNESTLLIELGLRIKRLRKPYGLSQVGLASKCDFEKSSMSKIEAGKTNVSYLTLCKIGDGLKMNLSDFFKD